MSAMRRGATILISTLVGTALTAAGAAAQDLGAMTLSQNQWVMAGRTYDLERFSPLTQITTANVGRLVPAWSFSLGALRGQEGNPLVIGTVMYVSTSFPNKVYALDLTKDGAPLLWQYTPDQDTAAESMVCCDVVNRGLAFHPPTSDHPSGVLYIELLQGDLLALDAKSGRKVYQAKSADFHKGETMSNAPLVVRNVVITGVSGTDYGVRGRITAFDALSGRELWRAYSTGPDADVKIQGVPNDNYESMRGKDLGASTWSGDAWIHGGGDTWGWYSYDPDLNLFYYGSGSPAPWNADQRPGDNKWTNSIWARNPETGVVKWVYQMTPHDGWDYAGVNEMILAELLVAGRLTKVLVHFDRNGFAYTVDRTNGHVILAQPYGPVNWAKSIDLTSGRPVENVAKRTTLKGNTEGVCPGSIGLKDQQPAAYSQKAKLFFVPMNNICMDFAAVDARFEQGQPYIGANLRMFAGPGKYRGMLIAWDALAGKAVWSDTVNLASYGGALATAGDLVFFGAMDGWFKAVDARTGKLLWKFKTPSGIVGNPITYVGPDGRQYVAVVSGIGGWAGLGVAAGLAGGDPTAGLGVMGAFGDLNQWTTPGGVLTVFALPPQPATR